MYLLDTNVISEIRKKRPHGAVLQWLRAQRADSLSLSAMTLMELQQGAEITRRQDRVTASNIESWIDNLSHAFAIHSLDGEVCREAARILLGKSDDLFEDGLIAATARVHGLTVATRNIRDFKQFDVPVFNPFTYAR